MTDPVTQAPAADPVPASATAPANPAPGLTRHCTALLPSSFFGQIVCEDVAPLLQKIQAKAEELKKHLDALEEDGSREISIAKTKIDEAVLWAVKHVTG